MVVDIAVDVAAILLVDIVAVDIANLVVDIAAADQNLAQLPLHQLDDHTASIVVVVASASVAHLSPLHPTNNPLPNQPHSQLYSRQTVPPFQ